MLEVKPRELNEMERLLNYSVKGCHFLFDRERMAKAARSQEQEIDFLSKKTAKKIQKLLGGLLSKKSFYQKQEYLNSLDHHNFELLVRTYLHIVDTTVMADLKTTH